jgi:hypothetical protein
MSDFVNITQFLDGLEESLKKNPYGFPLFLQIVKAEIDAAAFNRTDAGVSHFKVGKELDSKRCITADMLSSVGFDCDKSDAQQTAAIELLGKTALYIYPKLEELLVQRYFANGVEPKVAESLRTMAVNPTTEAITALGRICRNRIANMIHRYSEHTCGNNPVKATIDSYINRIPVDWGRGVGDEGVIPAATMMEYEAHTPPAEKIEVSTTIPSNESLAYTGGLIYRAYLKFERPAVAAAKVYVQKQPRLLAHWGTIKDPLTLGRNVARTAKGDSGMALIAAVTQEGHADKDAVHRAIGTAIMTAKQPHHVVMHSEIKTALDSGIKPIRKL